MACRVKPGSFPLKKKLEIINAMIQAGIKRLQVTSFVNPKMVPQMADAENLCAGLTRQNDVVYSALVLNPKGMARAAKAGVSHVTASISASNTHSQRNAGMSLDAARKQFSEMAAIGKKHGLTIRGGLQCVFGCRFEGRIDPAGVLDMVKEQLDLGIDEIELADSTGMADPQSIRQICSPIITAAGDTDPSICIYTTRRARGWPMRWPPCRSASLILTPASAAWGLSVH